MLLAFAIALAASLFCCTRGGQALDERSVARGLAVIVNDALTSYIEAHDDVFKVSVKRLVPNPGVFEAIDFKSHVEALTMVEHALNQAGVTAKATLDRGVTDPDVRQFLGSMQTYRLALLDAIQQFQSVSEELCRVSQNTADYKWATYQNDLDAYDEATKRYKELGTELNTTYKRIK